MVEIEQGRATGTGTTIENGSKTRAGGVRADGRGTGTTTRMEIGIAAARGPGSGGGPGTATGSGRIEGSRLLAGRLLFPFPTQPYWTKDLLSSFERLEKRIVSLSLNQCL